ncbi:hypothetical protein JCM6882_001644 [Rhodosporidiobolus microsporus]
MRTWFVSLAAAVVAAASSAAADRTFTVKNNCPWTLWPAIFTSAGTAPSQPRGWEASAGHSVSFSVAENWNGRIWARTQCTFRGQGLPDDCVTGGCNGGIECATVGGTGRPPASLIEVNLNADVDWYNLSGVDGVNVATSITNNVGCPSPDCNNAGQINSNCPAELAVHNPEGVVVGCLSACAANLDGNQQNSPNCCSGSYDRPETCPASGVAYYSLFKDACPSSYAYAYDEASQSALWTCPKNLRANYVITFCPLGY